MRTRLRDRSRAAGKRAHGLAAKLRSRRLLGRDQVHDGVQRITGELADLAQAAARDAQHLLMNARRGLRRARANAVEGAKAGIHDAAAGRRRGRLARAVHELSSLLEPTEQIIKQTRQRIGGTTPDGASRVVSLHDRDARPIAKGRLGKPVEFGYKGQIVDNDDGIVVDHDLQAGNPADAPQLAPAIQRVKARAGRAPRTVTADRGYGEAAVDDALASLGVRTVVIPRKGRPGPGPTAARTTPNLPQNHQVANRMRRPHQHPQTRIRRGPHPGGQRPASESLDRAGNLHPQPDQDRRIDRVTPSSEKNPHHHDRQSATRSATNTAIRVFQVEVTSEASLGPPRWVAGLGGIVAVGCWLRSGPSLPSDDRGAVARLGAGQDRLGRPG